MAKLGRKIFSIALMSVGFILLMIAVFNDTAYEYHQRRAADLKACYQDPTCDLQKREWAWEQGYYGDPNAGIFAVVFAIGLFLFVIGLFSWPIYLGPVMKE